MSQISRNLWPGAPLRKRHSEPRVLADGVADMCCSQWRFNWLWQGPLGCQLVSIYSIPTDVAICCNNKPCRVYQFVAGWNKSSKLRPNQSQMLHPTTGCTVLKPSTAVWLCGSCSAGKSATWWKAHFLVLPRPQSLWRTHIHSHNDWVVCPFCIHLFSEHDDVERRTWMVEQSWQKCWGQNRYNMKPQG